jgi:hypothetical protein
MVWLNVPSLMGQSFVPCPTLPTGKCATNRLAINLFDVVVRVIAPRFIALHAYIFRQLIKPKPAGGNIFADLLETLKHASLGQITRTLFEVGGATER